MELTRELIAYLANAAQGDQSDCPPEIDVQWHACLAHPQEYEDFCLKTFGCVIDHIAHRPGRCYARTRCRAQVRR